MNVEIEMKYKYTGTFNPSAEIQSEAASWYKNGTQVIFSCGGGMLPERGSDIQVCAGLPGIPLRELDPEADQIAGQACRSARRKNNDK